jgi:hypothetical protein
LLPDLAQREPAVRRLVMVMAYGYFAMIDAEAIAAIAGQPLRPIVVGRSADQVWPYWVTNMSTGTLLAPKPQRPQATVPRHAPVRAAVIRGPATHTSVGRCPSPACSFVI